MKYLLLSLTLSSMLSAGLLSAQNEASASKPFVILIDATTELYEVSSEFPMTLDFISRATESLEEVCLSTTNLVGSHKKSSHITLAEKENAQVILQLEIALNYECSRVKQKKKWGYKPLGGNVTLAFKYSGEVDIITQAYIVIRDPESFGLLKRVEIDLTRTSATILSQEPSKYSDVMVTLKEEDILGVTDVIDDTVKEISDELDDELHILFNDAEFINSLLNY